MPTTWPTSPPPSPKGRSALEEGYNGARQPSQRSSILEMQRRGWGEVSGNLSQDSV